ncbi:MAG: phytanoyl-CoA dioxygenase family protein [Phenylobacterium sp.]
MIPVEFTPEAIEAASQDAFLPYGEFLRSGEPYASIARHNPWTKVPSARSELEWGKGWYYDTTVARKHPDWADTPLPRPTRRMEQLRRDFHDWGYCLIADALSAEQCARIRERVVDQAAAERDLGVAYLSPAQQHVWSLVNKGEVFRLCLEHDPEAVQGGPMIERLLDEFIGAGWQHYSFLSNISYPGCHPQGLHRDQSFPAPYDLGGAPALVNTISYLQDVDEVNGGTLVIPGSHRSNGSGGETYGALPRPVNLEAPAGTIMLMDGRTLHAGAVNRSDRLRYILTNSVVRPWVRQQEAFLLSVRPEVLAKASDKLLYRLGYSAHSSNSMVEGYGYFGNGRAGDPNGAIVHARRAMDRGGYAWMGTLSRNHSTTADVIGLGLARIQRENEPARTDGYAAAVSRITAL